MQQDYIMRMIEEMGRALRRILYKRSIGKDDEALQYILHCLQRHLGLEPEQLAQCSPQQLLGLLTMDQTHEDARDRCLAFAALQHQAGLIYLEKGTNPDVARSAFYLALLFALHGWTAFPQDASAASVLSLDELMAHVDERQLPPEVRAQLDACRAAMPSAPKAAPPG